MMLCLGFLAFFSLWSNISLFDIVLYMIEIFLDRARAGTVTNEGLSSSLSKDFTSDILPNEIIVLYAKLCFISKRFTICEQ